MINRIQLVERIETISNQLGLRHLTVIDFLLNVSRNSGTTSRDLIRELGIPQTQLYKLIRGFADIVDPNKKQVIEIVAALVDQIRNETEKMKKEYSIDTKKSENILKKYFKKRPTAERNLDQFTATPDTSVKRVAKMARSGDLKERYVAFLGDDDLTSVIAALAGQAKGIYVFEIDQRLVDLIETISKENDLNIKVVKQDLRQSIPKQFYRKFDTVFTDPPYTPKGVNTFLNQAINLLSPRLLSRIYLCYGNSDRAREREVEIQKILVDHNLLIKDKIYQFNKYYEAESIGSSSSLYVLDWTPRTRTLRMDNKKVYTNE